MVRSKYIRMSKKMVQFKNFAQVKRCAVLVIIYINYMRKIKVKEYIQKLKFSLFFHLN